MLWMNKHQIGQAMVGCTYVGQINDSYTKKSTMHRLDIVEFDLKSSPQLMRSNCKMCACHWKTVFSVFTTFDFNE